MDKGMKKSIIFALMLMLGMAVCGCGKNDAAKSDANAQMETEVVSADNEGETADEKVTDVEENSDSLDESNDTAESEDSLFDKIGKEDVFFVANEEVMYEADGERIATPIDENWQFDILIREDGTARIRDIREDMLLYNPDGMDVSWEKDDSNRIYFNSEYYSSSELTGKIKDNVLYVEYCGLYMAMVEEEAPKTVGEIYSPAQLQGSWILVSGETDGDKWEALPEIIESLVFEIDYSYDNPSLRADSEWYNWAMYLEEYSYGQELTLVNKPLYSECANEKWCVRIGSKSPVDENGNLKDVETYVTLVDSNILEVQMCYTLDDSPAVSYATYYRIPPVKSSWTVGYEEILDMEWVLTDYTDIAGSKKTIPSAVSEFGIQTSGDGTCHVGNLYEDINKYDDLAGLWYFCNGGIIVLQGNDGYLYIGGLRAFGTVVDEEYVEKYQLYVYYNDGILIFESNGVG